MGISPRKKRIVELLTGTLGFTLAEIIDALDEQGSKAAVSTTLSTNDEFVNEDGRWKIVDE